MCACAPYPPSASWPTHSWDRQPYLTFSGVDDGFGDAQGRSIIKANDTQTGNLMLNGYNGVWAIDHDDGSQFHNDMGNFMVFGGCKNYLGNHKQCDDNVILYPGTSGRSAGGHRCQTDDNGVFAEQFHLGNVCATEDGRILDFAGCNAGNVNSTAYATAYVLNPSGALVPLQIRFVLQGNVISGEQDLGNAIVAWVIVLLLASLVAMALLQRRTLMWTKS